MAVSPVLERALACFEPARRPAAPEVRDGYLDLLGDADPSGAAGRRAGSKHASARSSTGETAMARGSHAPAA